MVVGKENKMKKFLIIIIVMSIIFISACEAYTTNVYNKIIKIDIEINNYKDLYAIAQNRAQEFETDLLLGYFDIVYEGIENIKNRTAVIEYSFGKIIDGKGSNGHSCRINVKIDLKEKAILETVVIKGNTKAVGFPERNLGIDKWAICESDIFDIIFNKISLDELFKYNNPSIEISGKNYGEDIFIISIENNGSEIERWFIDSYTGEEIET